MMVINIVNKRYHQPTPIDVYIGRGSVLGNPYTSKPLSNTKALYQCESRTESIQAYKSYLLNEIKNRNMDIIYELMKIYKAANTTGVNLVCYCAPKKCHGDVIKELLTFIYNRKLANAMTDI